MMHQQQAAVATDINKSIQQQLVVVYSCHRGGVAFCATPILNAFQEENHSILDLVVHFLFIEKCVI